MRQAPAFLPVLLPLAPLPASLVVSDPLLANAASSHTATTLLAQFPPVHGFASPPKIKQSVHGFISHCLNYEFWNVSLWSHSQAICHLASIVT